MEKIYTHTHDPSRRNKIPSSLTNFFLLILLGLSLPRLAFAQPAVPSGDCGRTTLFFDGATNVTTSIPELSGTTQGSGTWEAWIKKDDWSTYNSDEKLFANAYDYPNESAFYVSLHSAVGFHFRTGGQYNGTYVPNAGTKSFVAGSWHHLAVTWSESSGTVTISIFIDGVTAGSTTSTYTFDIGSAFYLGGMDGEYKFKNGQMAEVRVWDLARTETEIADNMNSLLTGTETGLVAYWPLNETAGSTTATNMVSTGSDGTVGYADASTYWKDFPLTVQENSSTIVKNSTFDFGTIVSGGGTTKTFTVYNVSGSSVDLFGESAVTLSGADAGQFSVDLTNTSTTIAAGASTTFDVTYSPTSTGSKSAAVSFTTVASCTDPFVINLTGDVYAGSIAFSGSGFTETSANIGSVAGSIIITLSGDTFDSGLDIGSGVSVTGVPSGLTPEITVDSETQATLTLTGSATANQSSDDVADITFTFTDAAFVGSTASHIQNTSNASSGLGISYLDNPTITFSGGGFTETAANLGGVTGSIIVTLSGDTFDSGLDETMVSVSNIPEGLSAAITRDSDTQATLTLTGSANAHQSADDVSDLSFTFADAAFVNSVAAAIFNGVGASSGLGIAFKDNPSITYSGDGFTEAAANDGSVEGAIYLKLANDSFQNLNGSGELKSTQVSIQNVPEGLTPHLELLDEAATPYLEWEDYQIDGSNFWTSLTYGNGVFLAVDDRGVIATSSDGIVWTKGTSIDRSWQEVKYLNGQFIAVGYSGNTSSSLIMTSTDGVNWTSRSSPINVPLASVTYGNGLYVVVSSSYDIALTSTDGITWSSTSLQQYASWRSVTYGNGVFVAVSSESNYRIMRSTDGTNWSIISPLENNSWWSVTYGEGLFVAVASSGDHRVMTSTDGENWTLRKASSSLYWNEVEYVDGLFVATAIGSDKNQMMVSSDGINWFTQDNVISGNWMDIAFGNGELVAISSEGHIIHGFRMDGRLILSGTANSHQTANDVSDLSFTFTDAAFVNSTVATVLNSNAASTGLGISFTDNPSLAYSGDGFTESSINDGSVTGSIIITLTGDTFDSGLDISSGVTVSNIPSGLTPAISRDSDTQATLTLTGNATSNMAADDVSDITFTFTDVAFASSSASVVLNANTASSGLGISFMDYPANSDCTGATALTRLAIGVDAPTSGTTVNAGYGSVSCDNSTTLSDVWYKFNSGSTGSIDITLTLGTASYLSGALYIGSCETSPSKCLTEVPLNIFVDLPVNTDVYLQVWNSDPNAAGTFTIQVNETPNTWSDGAWSYGSAPSASDNARIYDLYEEHGSLEVKDLEVLYVSEFYLPGQLGIYDGGSVTVNGTLTNKGYIGVLDGGSLVTLGGLSTTGEYIVKRTTTFNNTTGQYSIVGSPIQQADFSVLGADALVYGYDESAPYNPSGNQGLDRFLKPSQQELVSMKPGAGYFSAYTGDADGVVTFQGEINYGDVQVSLSYTDQGSTEEVPYQGFNLLSNPYPAAVDFTALMNANSSVDIDESIYIWDDYSSNADRGTNADYLVVNATLGNTDSRGNGESKWDGYIRSVQGFFVKANSANQTFTFTDATKVATNNGSGGYFRLESVTRYKLRLSDENSSKATIIGYLEDATIGKDNAYDASKMSGGDLQWYSLMAEGAEPLSIQGLPKGYQEAVALGYAAGTAGQFTIDLMNQDEVNGEVWLYDALTDQKVELSSTTYTFTSQAGTYNSRFRLMKATTILAAPESIQFNVYTSPDLLHLTCNQPIPAQSQYRVMDLMGRVVLNGSTSDHTKSLEIPTNGLSGSVYILQLVTDRQVWRGKVILK